jgi:transcriptional regulator with XRE-family HTH domain
MQQDPVTLESIRAANDWTRPQAARRADPPLSPVLLGRIERGERKLSVQALRAIRKGWRLNATTVDRLVETYGAPAS